jgi:hypothetical protein
MKALRIGIGIGAAKDLYRYRPRPLPQTHENICLRASTAVEGLQQSIIPKHLYAGNSLGTAALIVAE